VGGVWVRLHVMLAMWVDVYNVRCHVLWCTSSINLFKMPSSSSHNYVIAQLHIRPQVDMAVVLIARLSKPS
jgi:hypothetical protein